MKFTTQLRDAFKYTLRDWKAIVLLGIFLCMASTFEEIHSNNLLILIVAFVVCTVLLFFEEGYRYKIIKETMKGNNNPPVINNLKELIKEGFYEYITISVYILILNILFWIVNHMEITSSIHFIQWTILYIISMAIYFLFFGAPINKILHGGKFFSAFNFIEIAKIYLKIGLKKTIILVIIGTISVNLILRSVLDYGIFNFVNFIDFLINFFISPVILLFLTRLIALIGKEVTYD